MKSQIRFSGKNKKNISKSHVLKNLSRVLSVKLSISIQSEIMIKPTRRRSTSQDSEQTASKQSGQILRSLLFRCHRG